jgi:hypothetical protein
MAAVAAAHGNSERAALLLGAAETARQRIHAPLQSLERAVYERTRAEVRRSLDDATFRANLEAGKAMDLEQALEMISAT